MSGNLSDSVIDAPRVAPSAMTRSLSKFGLFRAKPIRQARYSILSETRELRRAPRAQQKLRHAEIVDLSRRNLGPCALVDVSDSGARLRLSSAARLPQKFYLTDNASARPKLMQLVWRKGQMAGVKQLS